jgi:cholestenol Delta-isomerase
MNYFRQKSAEMNASDRLVPAHPYSPLHITINGYQPNTRTTIELLLSFAVVWVPIFLTTWAVAARLNQSLKTSDKVIMMWFTLCKLATIVLRQMQADLRTGGCLHVFFEGYFVQNHDRIGELQDLFGQLWKEYALSDSRYLTSDTFVLSAEGMSVLVLGSLSWSMVYLIGSSSPYRHPVQIMVCVGHLYSDLLYYATAMLDFYRHGIDYCRPEPYYFWVYYFGMNFIWIVIPFSEFENEIDAEAS